MPPQMYPSSILQSLKQAFTPRRTEDIELLQEPTLPESPPNPFVSEPYIPDVNNQEGGLPPLFRAGAFGEGEVPSISGITGSIMKGRASYGGPRLNTEGALAGLKGASQDQLIPGRYSLGEEELSRLAARAPGTVAPGSNEYFAAQLRDELGRQASFLGPQQKNQEAIETGIAGLHPALQAGAEREAQRRAYPQVASAQAQADAARVAAESRLGVAETMRRGDVRRAKMGHMNAVMAAIQGIQRKPKLTPPDRERLTQLEGLYRALDEEVNADEDYEDYGDEQ